MNNVSEIQRTELSPVELAGKIDHSYLKSDGTIDKIEKLCEEARKYGFAIVAVNPADVDYSKTFLKGTQVKIGAAIGFPLGLNTTNVKEICKIALNEGAGFVKTSTGFGIKGATVEDIKLMRHAVGPGMGVKASGGIRDLNTVIKMINAGATRIGTSSSVEIIKELEKKLGKQR